MQTIKDSEFGEIIVRRHHNAKRASIRFDTKRRLTITAPRWTPLYVLKRTIDKSRSEIRQIAQSVNSASQLYEDGLQIGKSHKLNLEPGDRFAHHRSRDELKITYPQDLSSTDESVQSYIRPEIAKLLRVQAEHYLPRRLEYLAKTYGYSYEKTRFSHASSRWGSCSTSGTISLNIALMNLPFELIDYVLIHELCHTVQMNHSTEFWALVAQADPDFKLHRKQLKDYHPNI